jgi:trk system potassium uptake protein TrkA
LPQQRSIAVIGLGVFGFDLAQNLARYGDRVLGVDISEKRVSAAADHMDRAIIADATEMKAMAEAGLGEYDAVVIATASDLEVSILSVVSAREAGAQTIWAKSRSGTHTRILEQVGVDRILHPSQSYAEQIAQQLHNPLVMGSVKLADGLHFASVKSPPKVCDKPLGKMRLDGEKDLRCVGILREGRFIAPHADELLCEVDDLLLIGSRAAMRAFADNN